MAKVIEQGYIDSEYKTIIKCSYCGQSVEISENDMIIEFRIKTTPDPFLNHNNCEKKLYLFTKCCVTACNQDIYIDDVPKIVVNRLLEVPNKFTIRINKRGRVSRVYEKDMTKYRSVVYIVGNNAEILGIPEPVIERLKERETPSCCTLL